VTDRAGVRLCARAVVKGQTGLGCVCLCVRGLSVFAAVPGRYTSAVGLWCSCSCLCPHPTLVGLLNLSTPCPPPSTISNTLWSPMDPQAQVLLVPERPGDSRAGLGGAGPWGVRALERDLQHHLLLGDTGTGKGLLLPRLHPCTVHDFTAEHLCAGMARHGLLGLHAGACVRVYVPACEIVRGCVCGGKVFVGSATTVCLSVALNL
jgi:hypothetical protein